MLKNRFAGRWRNVNGRNY